MRPIPFDANRDLAPIPFDERLLASALEMKNLGLTWHPHVGCFVWDATRRIQPDSPFPHNVYFVLSMPRFIGIFGSLKAMQEELVWVPTWHQARLLCRRMGVADEAVANACLSPKGLQPGKEENAIYRLLIEALKSSAGRRFNICIGRPKACDVGRE
jgi:hypothetical protein